MANNKLLNVVDRYFPSQSPQLNICTSTSSVVVGWVGLGGDRVGAKAGWYVVSTYKRGG